MKRPAPFILDNIWKLASNDGYHSKVSTLSSPLICPRGNFSFSEMTNTRFTTFKHRLLLMLLRSSNVMGFTSIFWTAYLGGTNGAGFIDSATIPNGMETSRKPQGVSPVSISIVPLRRGIHHVIARIFNKTASTRLVFASSNFGPISGVTLELGRNALGDSRTTSFLRASTSLA